MVARCSPLTTTRKDRAMAANRLPDQEYLSKILDYNPETGGLFWLYREDARKEWNTQFAGKPAFTAINDQGYHCGSVDRKNYRAHRIIWKLCKGTEPNLIDHINGVRSDNRISNLRSVSHAQNQRNQKIRTTNRSGVTGVGWVEKSRKWRAQIMVEGKAIHLGMFTDVSDAINCRKLADKKFGFHENHGKSSCP